jgi:hypothetical protein
MTELTNDASQLNCCQAPDPETAIKCESCAAPACGNCSVVIDEVHVCSICLAKLEAELRAETILVKGDIPKAFFGAFIGSLIGAAGWVGLVVVSGYNIGYAAVGVGWLAGQGTYFPTKKKSTVFQILAVSFFIFAFILSKYGIFLNDLTTAIMKEHDTWEPTLSFYLSSAPFPDFTKHYTNYFSFFDILWIFIGAGAANQVVRPGIRN